MLRQISLVALLVFLLSALVMLDFKAAQRRAIAGDLEAYGFVEHVIGFGPRLVQFATSGFGSDQTENSPRLMAMMPRMPDGWDSRALDDDDLAALLSKNPKNDDPATIGLIQDILSPRASQGAEVAMAVYAAKGRLVVFKLIRQPDDLFTDPARRRDLDAMIASRPSSLSHDFMRVRGMDVAEIVLPDRIRARVFTAELGAQLRLWVLASKKMGDDDLVPFFETLDVAAMNAAVRDKEHGMGEIPLIVVVSDLREAERTAYEADRAARSSERAARLARVRLGLDARDGAGAKAALSASDEGCETLTGGAVICISG